VTVILLLLTLVESFCGYLGRCVVHYGVVIDCDSFLLGARFLHGRSCLASESCQEFDNGCRLYVGCSDALNEVSDRNILDIDTVIDCRGDPTIGRLGQRGKVALPANVTRSYFGINHLTEKRVPGHWGPSFHIVKREKELEAPMKLAFAAINRGRGVPLV
jgi:hypothetical protein